MRHDSISSLIDFIRAIPIRLATRPLRDPIYDANLNTTRDSCVISASYFWSFRNFEFWEKLRIIFWLMNFINLLISFMLSIKLIEFLYSICVLMFCTDMIVIKSSMQILSYYHHSFRNFINMYFFSLIFGWFD